jgi:hypothetical protein
MPAHFKKRVARHLNRLSVGEEAQITRYLPKTDCLFFIVQPGKFDYVPVKGADLIDPPVD